MSLHISRSYEFSPLAAADIDPNAEDAALSGTTGPLGSPHRGAPTEGGWPVPEASGDLLGEISYEETPTGFIGRAVLTPTAALNAIEIGE